MRVELLVWLAVQGKLNTREKLARMGVLNDGIKDYPICHKEEETTHHLFITCELAGRLWHEARTWWNTHLIILGHIETLFEA